MLLGPAVCVQGDLGRWAHNNSSWFLGSLRLKTPKSHHKTMLAPPRESYSQRVVVYNDGSGHEEYVSDFI